MSRTIEPGQTFVHQRECDPYRPLYYAAASGDFNPIHIDDAVAKQVGLGGAILQGMCTMAWGVEAAVNFLGDPGALRRCRVRFTKPVALGDTVRLEGRVISADAGSVRGEIVARNQRGEEVLTGAFEGELPEAR